MRFLCLPGGYCNAKVLETQLGPICEALSSNGNDSFHYTQGTTEVQIPPEYAGFYGPPPNYTFLDFDTKRANMRDFPKRDTPEDAIKAALQTAGNPSFSCITQVVDRLVGILDSDDDIGGVIGFSEGAQVAASLILEERRRESELGRIPRLKCAIMFGGWPPIDPVTGKLVMADDFDEVPITIPTCHIIGTSDPFLAGSVALYHMCDPDTADLFDHGAGHTIPREKKTAHEIAVVVREMINSVA